MADRVALEVLHQSVDRWNWQRTNASISLDLSSADLRGTDLRQANLREANLSGTDLGEANLSEAIESIMKAT